MVVLWKMKEAIISPIKLIYCIIQRCEVVIQQQSQIEVSDHIESYRTWVDIFILWYNSEQA